MNYLRSLSGFTFFEKCIMYERGKKRFLKSFSELTPATHTLITSLETYAVVGSPHLHTCRSSAFFYYYYIMFNAVACLFRPILTKIPVLWNSGVYCCLIFYCFSDIWNKKGQNCMCKYVRKHHNLFYVILFLCVSLPWLDGISTFTRFQS